MNIYKADKNAKRDNVLNDKKFIAPTTDRRHGTENNPNQYGPGSQTFPGNLIIFELIGNVVVSIPSGEKIAHMDGSRHEHTSGAPSMQPVETFIADTTKVSDDVVLAGKKKDEWKLTECYNSTPKCNILLGKASCKIKSVQAKNHESNGIRYY
jgi:hypothetical protein